MPRQAKRGTNTFAEALSETWQVLGDRGELMALNDEPPMHGVIQVSVPILVCCIHVINPPHPCQVHLRWLSSRWQGVLGLLVLLGLHSHRCHGVRRRCSHGFRGPAGGRRGLCVHHGLSDQGQALVGIPDRGCEDPVQLQLSNDPLLLKGLLLAALLHRFSIGRHQLFQLNHQLGRHLFGLGHGTCDLPQHRQDHEADGRDL
mmetsp:Transcript_81637/g.195810  ORF Transcript_81637/g.195810 Transcript_81637/m.195810 type:complete len:202 (+) Transcript_81637:196-801(+)